MDVSMKFLLQLEWSRVLIAILLGFLLAFIISKICQLINSNSSETKLDDTEEDDLSDDDDSVDDGEDGDDDEESEYEEGVINISKASKKPSCQFCGTSLEKINYISLSCDVVYFCPNCNKILNITNCN